uniref:GCF C-terminal domain-containing protein n=1 Tax=Plectus sambesii TaxID=2011161 RepID=A0A914UW43_9BILA
MFKKTNRQNIRRQRRTSDDELGDENGLREGTDDGAKNGGHNAAPPAPPPVINKVVERTPSPPSTKPANLLSFDVVEEGDDAVEFKIKKSSESRRLEKFQRRLKKEKGRRETSEEAPDEGVRAATIKEEPRSPVGRTKSPIAKGDFDDATKREDENARSKDPTWNKFRSVYTEGGIPDAQAVYRARKQREKARVEGDSFIPLEDDTQRLKDKGEVRSRLVREDDNDASDEETGRFYSARSLVITEEERRRTEQAEFLAAEQGESEDDSDDELARWEQEQIRKGISAQQISAFQQEHHATRAFYGKNAQPAVVEQEVREPEPMEMEIEMEMDFVESRKLPKPGGGPSTMVSKAPTVSIEDVIANLRDRLSDGELHMNTRKFEKQKLADNLAENTAMISKLELTAPRLQQQYNLYQEMRVYSRNLLECLDETIGKIDELEDSMMGLLKNRAEYVIRRRRQDVRDQYDECSAAAAGKAQSFVRTPDVAIRAAEREARRGRRRQAREKQLTGVSHHEGMSSDDEETPSQIAIFKDNLAQLSESAQQIFADALEEYSSIDAICERIVHWLAVDAPSFEDAFIEMCIPKLLSPIIRLQLIDWNPLAAESPPLDTMDWYTSLLAVGSHNLDVDKEHSTIVGLIPAVIEKVLLLKLTRKCFSVGSFAPLSSVVGMTSVIARRRAAK